jgi:hypothetical protein
VTDIDPTAPSPAERHVATCTERGERADLQRFPDPDRVVRAALLRALLLGVPLEPPEDDGGARVYVVRAPGVRLVGARIEGPLDLTDCTGTDAGALPGLTLEDCDLTDGVDLSNAHLTRLSLEGSRIHKVRLRGLRLDGSLDFAGVHGATPLSAAWIDAYGVVVRGEVRGHGAKLRVLPEPRIVVPGQQRYALQLYSAAIDGSVLLRDGVEAIGGVNVAAARIRGDFSAIGARMEAGEGDALRAQAVRIDGVMLLDHLDTNGCVWLVGAKIGGTLQFNGATLRNRTDNGRGTALAAFNAEIAGDVRLDRAFTAEIGGDVRLDRTFTAEGRVSLDTAKIGGTLRFNGAMLRNRTVDGLGKALSASNAEIGGDVQLNRAFSEEGVQLRAFSAEGGISLVGAKIGGALSCEGATLRNGTCHGNGAALDVANAEIGGPVLLRDTFTAEGRVILLGAKIGRDLQCSKARLRNETRHGLGSSITLQDARIGGRLRFDQCFVSLGRISLWGCQIGSDMDCTRGRFIAPPPPDLAGSSNHPQSALDAINLRVMGDVILRDTTVVGSLTFEHATIAGSLRWDRMTFPREMKIEWPKADGRSNETEMLTWTYAGSAPATPNAAPRSSPDPQPILNLANAHIEAALRAHHLATEVPLKIDLSATRVHTLDDVRDGDAATDCLEGWGRKGVVKLDLDGFVYDRIEHFFTHKEATTRIDVLLWIGNALVALVHALTRPACVVLRRPVPSAARWLDQRVNDFCKWTRRVFGGEAGVAQARLAWLERGAPGPGNFYPQPYRQLAAVMRIQGHVEAARLVAVAEQDKAPRSGWPAFWRPVFGFCFGHGLKPVNATATLLVLLLLGTGLVWWAWKSPAKNSVAFQRGEFTLVLTPTAVAAKSAEDALAGKHPTEVPDRRCDKHDIMPLFYALDMMLPVIPLHQEDRCEVASRPGTEGWQIAWAVFSIVGKIVTSLTLLTYAGVLKSKEE